MTERGTNGAGHRMELSDGHPIPRDRDLLASVYVTQDAGRVVAELPLADHPCSIETS